MNMYLNIMIDVYAFKLYNYAIKLLLTMISSESCLHMHNNWFLVCFLYDYSSYNVKLIVLKFYDTNILGWHKIEAFKINE